MQNTSARILCKVKKYDHISPVLKDLHWLRIKDRIDFKVLMLVYKCLNDLAPPYLSELLTIYEPRTGLRSEQKIKPLIIPKTRLVTYGDRAFSHIGPVLWNDLPLNVKTATSLENFKSKLKSYMFSRW